MVPTCNGFDRGGPQTGRLPPGPRSSEHCGQAVCGQIEIYKFRDGHIRHKFQNIFFQIFLMKLNNKEG